MLITNAFSINMLPQNPWGSEHGSTVQFYPLTVQEAARLLKKAENRGEPITNAIGHPDTALLVYNILSEAGYTLPQAERISVRLEYNLLYPVAIVAQYSGPRLPEGATTLPEGATITFWGVRVAPSPNDLL
jgi:hypothetical protein